jgi:hypothetical protein
MYYSKSRREYKRFSDGKFKLAHLTYEEAKNIVETLDESLIIQREYEYHQLSEDLARDKEDIKVVLP